MSLSWHPIFFLNVASFEGKDLKPLMTLKTLKPLKPFKKNYKTFCRKKEKVHNGIAFRCVLVRTKRGENQTHVPSDLTSASPSAATNASHSTIWQGGYVRGMGCAFLFNVLIYKHTFLLILHHQSRLYLQRQTTIRSLYKLYKLFHQHM